METKETADKAQGVGTATENKKLQFVDATKQREKTVSLTITQLNELEKEPKLIKLISDQVEQSEGNLKGNMAFNVAKALLKQLSML